MTSKTTAQPAPAADGARVRDAKGKFVGGGSSSAKSTGPKRRARKAKVKRVAWSMEREDKFLETLAQTANVTEGVRISGLSDTSVYRRRGKSSAFRARWATALREGFVKLETEMLRRALAGVDKPVFHLGKQVGTIKDYDNRTCLALLTAHRGAVTGAAPVAATMTEDEVRKALSARLSEMNRNMGGDG